MQIADRRIGPNGPVYVIAEMSANHNQDLGRAIALIHAAREAGADAVKIQTYTPDTITIDADTEYFRIKGTQWAGQTLHELYGKAYTPWEWHRQLFDTASEVGLAMFSSPFDATAVSFLEEIGTPAYKIASFENVDIPLLRLVARTGKPVIVSTGMASLQEVEEAVTTLRSAGASEIALLKCTSAYPAPIEAMNLRTIPDLAERFKVVAGLSDHSMDVVAPVVATTLGACLIEKHLTLSRSDGGPDSGFSLEPEEFAAMVRAVRDAEATLGRVGYGATSQEKDSRVFRRSLFVVRDMEPGELFSAANVRSIRPGHGLHTRHLDEIMGRKAATRIRRGTPLSWDLIA